MSRYTKSWNSNYTLLFYVNTDLSILHNYSTLQWRHNERGGLKSPASSLSTQPLIQAQVKKKHQNFTSLACVWGFHRWHPRASNTENVSIGWLHHDFIKPCWVNCPRQREPMCYFNCVYAAMSVWPEYSIQWYLSDLMWGAKAATNIIHFSWTVLFEYERRIIS